ncbi:methyltransferase [Alphaproteobacteria bacterium]|nr:methyltransferase [Alphaproteobacteria bacterium]
MPIVGDGIEADTGTWKFSGKTVDAFDNHVSKSVPLYHEGHNLITDVSDYFVRDNSLIYELGCSTGSLTINLAKHNQKKSEVRHIGIDIEKDMITKAKEKQSLLSKSLGKTIHFEDKNIIDLNFEKSDLIICYYTLQFTSPSVRQIIVDKIYESLNWGGAFLFFEKVRGADARFQDILTGLYTDFKLRNDYTPDDIIAKTRSLKGVMEPFSTQGNLDLMSRAGFVDVNTVLKYTCFEGWLAIK